MWDPWGTLKEAQGRIKLIWRRPHPLAPAATDGHSRIWIDPRATQRERRCLLAHELIHLEHQHYGCQPPAVERMVRESAARRLVTMQALLSEARWTRNLYELAETLHVTELVLSDRLTTLTPDEQHALRAVEEDHL